MKRCMFLFTILMTALAMQGCSFISLDMAEFMGFQPLEERVIREGGRDKILVVEILGPIRTTAARDGFVKQQGTLERLDDVFHKAVTAASVVSS